MKKLLSSKKFIQKMIIAILIVMSFNFIAPTASQAWGGIIMGPVLEFVVHIGDTILSVLQNFLYDGGGHDGIANMLLGASMYRATAKFIYPEMYYGGTPSNEEAKLVIDASNFNGINGLDVAETVVMPVIGLVKVAKMAAGTNFEVPIRQYTIDKIFSGQIPAFDINFINPNVDKYKTRNGIITDGKVQIKNGVEVDGGTLEALEIGDEVAEKHIASQIQKTVAKWYVSLRNFAIVGLLSVLVYVGIRMVISSTASDKAKYKQMLIDWLVALCLLFVLHYIMAFIITMTEEISGAIAGTQAYRNPILVKITNTIGGDFGFYTDLMGVVRLKAQYKDFTTQVSYLILYIALIVYTVKFTWVYMKRTITMMFLTLIAPIVALTYPIDKLNDGKAQAFNMWLKEYIFTALLQPFHLIIYTVLLGTAIEIAVNNPIYAIMVLAFIGPAEKLLRKFFGFDKASTPGMLSQAGAMFGGAAAFNMLKKSAGFIANRGAQHGGSQGGNNIRTSNNGAVADPNAPETLADVVGRNNQDLNGGPQSPDSGRNLPSGLTDEEELERNNLRNELDNADYNDMYLNPELYQERQDRLDELERRRQEVDVLPSDTEQQEAEPQQNTVEEQSLTGNSWTGTASRGTARRLRDSRLLASAPARRAGKYAKEWAVNKFGTPERRNRTLKSAATTVGKFGARVAVAGAIGAVGVGMGIVGDDLEDVLKLGTAGGALGYGTAPAVGKRISNAGIVKAMTGKNTDAAKLEAMKNEMYQSGVGREKVASWFKDKDGNAPTGQELNKLEDRYVELATHEFDEKEIKKVMKIEKSLQKGFYKNLPEEEREDSAKVLSEVIVKKAKDIDVKKLSNEGYQKETQDAFKAEVEQADPATKVNGASQKYAQEVMKQICGMKKKPYLLN